MNDKTPSGIPSVSRVNIAEAPASAPLFDGPNTIVTPDATSARDGTPAPQRHAPRPHPTKPTPPPQVPRDPRSRPRN